MQKVKKKYHRLFLRGFLISTGILLLGTAIAYWWFINNANSLLIGLVHDKTQGKMQLQLSSVSFNVFAREVQILNASLRNTKKATAPITYNIAFNGVSITTNSLWSAFLSRKLEVRSIKMQKPVIEVVNHAKKDSSAVEQLALGVQLGKLYHSVDNVITTLNTRSISLQNARVVLINKADPESKPLEFSNIYFTLTRPEMAVGQTFDGSNIQFSSSNQDLTLSDGVHKLLFKKLTIQNARNILMDTCSIIALPKSSEGNSFNIHFKKLALIGVDFHALSQLNRIRADSVYCEDPAAYIYVNSAINPKKKKLSRDDFDEPNKMVQDIAGDLDLGFVGVHDATIYFRIRQNKAESNFTSGKVNFEITKLRVDPTLAQPVSLKSFDMLINGYQLYNADRSCIYTFDSIRFANDKLLLNNFSVNTASNNDQLRDYRNFRIPYFELSHVDWPELIFRQNLRANKALLVRPTFEYRQMKKPVNRKTELFDANHTFDDFMQIGILDVEDGKVSLTWNNSNTLELAGFSATVYGDNITDYKHVRQKDIQSLFFKDGYLKAGGLEAALHDITFESNHQLKARSLSIQKSNGAVEAEMNGISIDNIYTDDNYGGMVLDGVKWNDAAVLINALPGRRATARKNSLIVRNVGGNNTRFIFVKNDINIRAYFSDIDIASLEKEETGPFELRGIHLLGNELSFQQRNMNVSAGGFDLSDTRQGFRDLKIDRTDSLHNLKFAVPEISIAKDIQTYLDHQQHFQDVAMQSPKFSFTSIGRRPADAQKIDSSSLTIDHLTMHQPEIEISIEHPGPLRKLSLTPSLNGKIEAIAFHRSSHEMHIGQLSLETKNLDLITKEKKFELDKRCVLQLADVFLSGKEKAWGTEVREFQLGKTGGFHFSKNDNDLRIGNVKGGNIKLTSALVKDVSALIAENPSAWVQLTDGSLINKKSVIHFFNPMLQGNKKEFTLDSLSMQPVKSQSEVISGSSFQTDYITFSSGAIKLTGFEAEDLFSDKKFELSKVSISNPKMYVFRDKEPPFEEGERKEFFTEKIRKLNMPVTIKEVALNEGEVVYVEKNKGNRLEGKLLLAHLNGNITNIRNENLQTSDSLHFSFTGRLLDKAGFSVQAHQSYTDSLHGFRMQVDLSPAKLVFLNPLLEPLASVMFRSGKIEQLQMTATGNENWASGEMHFFYSGLKIKLLKNGGLDSSKFIKPIESALINTLLLRRKNENRPGLVFFRRIKDHSFFNYMNNIILSGIITSVGVKRNKRYEKQISRLNLAPLKKQQAENE